MNVRIPLLGRCLSLLTLLMVVGGTRAVAQTADSSSPQAPVYRSEMVRQAVQRLGLAEAVAEQAGQPQVAVFDRDGATVVVRIGADRSVEHVGMPLFPSVARQLQQSPVYDFLELALLNHHFHVVDNPFWADRLTFRVGGWNDLEQVGDTCAWEVENQNGKTYQVSWTHSDGEPIAAVVFPISHTLLANSTQREMERQLVAQLTTDMAEDTLTTPSPALSALQPYGPAEWGLYVQPGERMDLADINANTYYQSPVSGQTATLLFDAAFPRESLANLLLVCSEKARAAEVEAVVHRCDFSKDTIRLPLARWQTVCRQTGCQTCVGYQGLKDGRHTMTAFVRNVDAGYAHVAVFSCTEASLMANHPSLLLHLYLFAPLAPLTAVE